MRMKNSKFCFPEALKTIKFHASPQTIGEFRLYKYVGEGVVKPFFFPNLWTKRGHMLT